MTTRARLAICGLVAAAALSGCGSGQISQMSTMEPAVNGGAVTVNHIAVRDIRIVARQTGDALEPGKSVDLKFTAVNQSPDVNDQLMGIRSDIGSVTIAGNATVPASGTLVVGTPTGTDASALAAQQGINRAQATVVLSEPISNGLTYALTFRFAKAGEATVAVPVAAPEDAPRAEQKPAAATGEAGHP